MPSQVLKRKEPLTEAESIALLESWRTEAKSLMERNTFPKLAEMICLRDYFNQGVTQKHKKIPQDVVQTSISPVLRKGFETEGIFGIGYSLNPMDDLPRGTQYFFGLTNKNLWVLGTLELQVTPDRERHGKTHTCTSVKIEVVSLLGTLVKYIRPSTILLTFAAEMRKVRNGLTDRGEKVDRVIAGIDEDLRSLPEDKWRPASLR